MGTPILGIPHIKVSLMNKWLFNDVSPSTWQLFLNFTCQLYGSVLMTWGSFPHFTGILDDIGSWVMGAEQCQVTCRHPSGSVSPCFTMKFVDVILKSVEHPVLLFGLWLKLSNYRQAMLRTFSTTPKIQRNSLKRSSEFLSSAARLFVPGGFFSLQRVGDPAWSGVRARLRFFFLGWSSWLCSRSLTILTWVCPNV